MTTEKWKRVGVCGVDAGLIWIGDPCYIIGKDPKEQPAESWSKFCDTINDEPAQQYNYAYGHSGLGVLVKHFGGDGVYPVFVKQDNEGNITETKIVFATK